jgi:undecaprenyl-diphosphatase
MKPIHRFDNKVTDSIRRLPQSWQSMMLAFSFIGEPLIVVTIGLICYLIAHARHHPAIEQAFIYAAIAYGINIALKLVLHRSRPHGLIIKTLGIKSYSFPSGHAFGTVLLYGLLAYLAFRHLSGAPETLLGVLLICLIFIIGVSRVYLGSHYPSDVLAGWALGTLALAAVINLP